MSRMFKILALSLAMYVNLVASHKLWFRRSQVVDGKEMRIFPLEANGEEKFLDLKQRLKTIDEDDLMFIKRGNIIKDEMKVAEWVSMHTEQELDEVIHIVPKFALHVKLLKLYEGENPIIPPSTLDREALEHARTKYDRDAVLVQSLTRFGAMSKQCAASQAENERKILAFDKFQVTIVEMFHGMFAGTGLPRHPDEVLDSVYTQMKPRFDSADSDVEEYAAPVPVQEVVVYEDIIEALKGVADHLEWVDEEEYKRSAFSDELQSLFNKGIIPRKVGIQTRASRDDDLKTFLTERQKPPSPKFEAGALKAFKLTGEYITALELYASQSKMFFTMLKAYFEDSNSNGVINLKRIQEFQLTSFERDAHDLNILVTE